MGWRGVLWGFLRAHNRVLPWVLGCWIWVPAAGRHRDRGATGIQTGRAHGLIFLPADSLPLCGARWSSTFGGGACLGQVAQGGGACCPHQVRCMGRPDPPSNPHWGPVSCWPQLRWGGLETAGLDPRVLSMGYTWDPVDLKDSEGVPLGRAVSREDDRPSEASQGR